MMRTFQAITDGLQDSFFGCQIAFVLCELCPLLLDFFRIVNDGTRSFIFGFVVLQPYERPDGRELT